MSIYINWTTSSSALWTTKVIVTKEELKEWALFMNYNKISRLYVLSMKQVLYNKCPEI